MHETPEQPNKDEINPDDLGTMAKAIRYLLESQTKHLKSTVELANVTNKAFEAQNRFNTENIKILWLIVLTSVTITVALAISNFKNEIRFAGTWFITKTSEYFHVFLSLSQKEKLTSFILPTMLLFVGLLVGALIGPPIARLFTKADKKIMK